MKRIDGSKTGIHEISWSPGSDWIVYVTENDEVRMANVETQEIRIIGKGRSPCLTQDLSVVFERDNEILIATGGGERLLVSKQDIVKDTPKQTPVLSPDSKWLLFVVCNVFDKESQQKNAYPYRHFIALTTVGSGKFKLTRQQWYGGMGFWFPDSTRLTHFEFDSTGGPRIHIVSVDGNREGSLAGLYPSVSPDGTRIAVRPRGGGSLVFYTSKGSWRDDDIETAVMRIPSGAGEHPSANPPIWLDNRFVLVDERDTIWRLDSKRDKAEEMKKFPNPTMRRKHSMAPSPSRDWLAMEVAVDQGFELRVISLK